MIYPLVRPLLFRLDPEDAHHRAVRLLRLAGALPGIPALLGRILGGPPRPVEVFGLTFPHPVGLAAGFDKDGLAWRGLAGLGFGHIEVGTVTPRPQPGNPRPRLFRLVQDGSLINRMGFPGHGADAVIPRLGGLRPRNLVLGVNLGKNNETPLAEAARDYLPLLRAFAPRAEYLAINVSCPNTPELRKLQSRDHLTALLQALARERDEQARALGRPVPLLLKISPDLGDADLDDALDALLAAGLDGIIATNTTTQRPPLRSSHASEEGGLSGAVLERASTRMVREIHRRTQGKLPIIGLGGVAGPDDLRRKLDAGAALVQVYTGLIYRGPLLVRRLSRGL